MKVTNVEKQEKSIVTITVEVGADEFHPAMDKAYKNQVKKLKVPGFRPGHAPRKMIEKMYGVEVFFDEAMNIAFPIVYSAAIAQEQLNPVERPRVEVETVTADGFTFRATFANYPDVKLGEYKGLTAQRPRVNVTEDDVERLVDGLRERNARIIPVEREAREGDTVVIDFEGKRNGVAFEGGSSQNYPLILGSKTFIPGFEEQIVGMKADEERDITVTFPEEYQAYDLAGQEVVFSIKLHEVKEKDLPEADDEFAKDVSEFDTIEELRDDLYEKEVEKREADAKAVFEVNLLDAAAANMECDIPDAMIENQMRRMFEDYKMQIQSQGISFDQYLKMTGADPDELFNSAREPALRSLRSSLLLDAVIKEEGIDATEEQIAAEYQELADQYQISVENVKQYVHENDVIDQVKRKQAMEIIAKDATAEVVEAKDEKEDE